MLGSTFPEGRRLSPRPGSPALRCSPVLVALLALSSSVACAHAPASARAGSVAVTPVDAFGVPPAEGEALRESMERRLAETASHPAVGRDKVDASGAAEARCRESEVCLAEAGRKVPADYVLAMTLAGLGQTRLVRTRLIGSESGLMLQDLQQTLTDPRALDPLALSLAQRLFPEPQAEKPWYGRWWVWTAAGAVAVTAVTVAVLVSRSPQPEGQPGGINVGKLP